MGDDISNVGAQLGDVSILPCFSLLLLMSYEFDGKRNWCGVRDRHPSSSKVIEGRQQQTVQRAVLR